MGPCKSSGMLSANREATHVSGSFLCCHERIDMRSKSLGFESKASGHLSSVR